MGNRWYVSLGDQEVGPLSDTGLERMIQGGRIEGDALVRNGLAGEWTVAREVEPILAARPGRRRPGEEAIEAARRAKYQQQQQLLQQQRQPQQPAPARPPAPASRIDLSPADRPPVSQPNASKGADQTVIVTKDILPAPDDLPLAATPDASRSTTGAPILSPYVVAPVDAAKTAPAPKRPSPYLAVAVGVGSLAVVAAICAAVWFSLGWFSLGGGLSSNRLPPQPQPAAVDPRLAALRQQAEQLRRELAEAKQQLESPPQPSVAPPPAEQIPPAAPEPVAKSDPPAAPEPVAKSDPPAASDPSAKPMAAPPAADLETQRKELAYMIATERSVAHEREKIQLYAEQVDSNPNLKYESTQDSELLTCLDEATEEVAKLDAKQLAARREEVSAARNKRYQEAADLEASVRSLLERIEIRQATMALGLSGILGPPEDPEITEQRAKRTEELSYADPNVVDGQLEKSSDSQLQRLIAEERLPEDWPDRSDDAMIAEAIRKCAVRLAPLIYGLRQSGRYKRRFDEARETIDLTTFRKMAFLTFANMADEDGLVTAAEATQIIDLFGVFDIGDLAPVVDAAPCQRFVKMLSDTGPPFITKLAQGKVQFETFRDVFEKVRKAAGDAWPPDDRPHPLAGRWKGKENWEIEIDPRRDRIVFRRSSPETTFEQQICKIGADHLIAYEKRKVPIEHMATDPFRTEKYDGNDRFPGPDDARPDEAIAFTYYSQSKGGAVLQIRRRIYAADPVQKSGGIELWEIIGNPKKYREFRATYRRVEE